MFLRTNCRRRKGGPELALSCARKRPMEMICSEMHEVMGTSVEYKDEVRGACDLREPVDGTAERARLSPNGAQGDPGLT